MQILSSKITHLTSINLTEDRSNYVISAIIKVHAVTDDYRSGDVMDFAFRFDQNPEDQNFVPYQSLTEEQILSWCKSSPQWEKMLNILNQRLAATQNLAQDSYTTVPPWQSLDTSSTPVNEVSPTENSQETSIDIVSENASIAPRTLTERELISLIRSVVTEILDSKK